MLLAMEVVLKSIPVVFDVRFFRFLTVRSRSASWRSTVNKRRFVQKKEKLVSFRVIAVDVVKPISYVSWLKLVKRDVPCEVSIVKYLSNFFTTLKGLVYEGSSPFLTQSTCK